MAHTFFGQREHGARGWTRYDRPSHLSHPPLTVTPAPLTIQANNASRPYGSANPVFSGTIVGLKNEDAITASYCTTATSSSPVGNYPIVPAAVDSVPGKLSNYVVTLINGTLRVMPVSLNTAYLAADPLKPSKTALYIYGTAGKDSILIGSGSGSNTVSVTINGVAKGVFRPTSRIIAHGWAGNDAIWVMAWVTWPAWLYGDEGNDTLIGGGGPSILEGGTGKDLLIGGNGRNILIGGGGADVLTAGRNGDILIGGSTNYAAHDAALLALLNEWNSAADYATRVGHITGSKPGGLNKGFYLNSSTVFGDLTSKDKLVGGIGMNLFYQALGDSLVEPVVVRPWTPRTVISVPRRGA